MPDRTYSVFYDTSSAVKSTQEISALCDVIQRLDGLVDKVTPKLKSMAVGVSTGFTNTAKASERLGASLDKVAASGDKATNSFRGLQSQTVGTATQIRVCGQNADHATGAFGEWASKGLHLNATLMRVGYAAAGIGTAVAVWKSFTDALQNAEEFAKETADHVLKLNDELREMKAITGQTAKEAREDVARLMTSSGMNEQEAMAFNTMWGSALTAAQKSGNWKLNAAETEKSRVEVATFARQNKIDAGAVGKMVPLMGTVQPLTSADQVLSELGGVHKMGIGAAGTFTQMARQLLKTEGGMVRPEGGGAFRSVAELSAGVSAMSAFTPMDRIPTELRAIWAEGASPKSKQEREKLGSIGITPGKTSMPEMISKYGDYLEGTRKKGVGDEDSLRNLGITSRTASRGVIDAVKAQKMWSANLAEVHKASDPAAMRKAMRATDVESPHALAEAALQAARNRIGEKEINLQALRPFLEAELEQNQGYVDPEKVGTSWEEKLQFPLTKTTGMEPPRTLRQNAIASEEIEKIRPGLMKFPPRTQVEPGLKKPGEFGFYRDLRSSAQVEEAINQLTPEEREKLLSRVQGLTVPAAVPMAPPAAANPGAVAPAARVPGAGIHPAAGAAAGPQVSLDAEQLRVLQSIDRKMGGSGGGYLDSLPIDGGDSGPRRA